ncbi:hypothetical protein G9A89_009841 [Geosiphon pyriformis]|nr:hypothetical protein G9A89_009841 [Geosiphon pyriformis]
MIFKEIGSLQRALSLMSCEDSESEELNNQLFTGEVDISVKSENDSDSTITDEEIDISLDFELCCTNFMNDIQNDQDTFEFAVTAEKGSRNPKEKSLGGFLTNTQPSHQDAIQYWLQVANFQTLERSRNKNLPNHEKISLEIFKEICFWLGPHDLFALQFTCKYFHELLSSPIDTITQKIWKTARQDSLNYLTLSPPPQISEQSYLELTMFDNGCHHCHGVTNDQGIYWGALLRLCLNCLRKNVMNADELRVHWDIPEELIQASPILTSKNIFKDGASYYWVPEIARGLNKYLQIDESQRLQWLQAKWIESQAIMQNIMQRESLDTLRILAKTRYQLRY